MKTLKDFELAEVAGGAPLAYRIGQLLRGAFMCVTTIGTCEFLGEVLTNEELSKSKN
ncbi:MAG: hypothetical protein LWW85_15520 [Marinilabiliales bacterium]|nr:hypothetical protein [Marinilabiliales bacterium]